MLTFNVLVFVTYPFLAWSIYAGYVNWPTAVLFMLFGSKLEITLRRR